MGEHIIVAVPTHSETLTTHTAMTLMRFSTILQQRGDKFTCKFYSSAVISELRNAMLAEFLHEGADALFMLDSDQGVEAQTLVRMLDLKKPLVGSMYPKRKFDWSTVKITPTSDINNILYQASEYVGRLESKRTDVLQFDVVNGFAKAIFIGTGAFLVRRQTALTMMEKYPALKDQGYNPGAFKGERFALNWGLFNPLSQAEIGMNLAEDYAFCHRWRVGCGGEIWADVTANVSHVGRYVYQGNYLDFMRARHAVQEAVTTAEPVQPQALDTPGDAVTMNESAPVTGAPDGGGAGSAAAAPQQAIAQAALDNKRRKTGARPRR